MAPLKTGQGDPAASGLIFEAVGLLLDEMLLLKNGAWEELPGFTRRKVVLASRLRKTDTAGRLGAVVRHGLISLLERTEALALHDIETHRRLLCRQILALQELDLYWRECASISLRSAAQQALAA